MRCEKYETAEFYQVAIPFYSMSSLRVTRTHITPKAKSLLEMEVIHAWDLLSIILSTNAPVEVDFRLRYCSWMRLEVDYLSFYHRELGIHYDSIDVCARFHVKST